MTRKHWYPITALILAGIGFADAIYLTIEHYTTFSLPCTITNGCDLVTTSAYSELFGVPVALLGALYYLSALLGIYFIFEFKKMPWLRFIAAFTTCGFLFSAWFVYAQIFLIHSVCQYCMASAIISTALFTISMIYLQKTKTSDSSPSQPEAPLE